MQEKFGCKERVDCTQEKPYVSAIHPLRIGRTKPMQGPSGILWLILHCLLFVRSPCGGHDGETRVLSMLAEVSEAVVTLFGQVLKQTFIDDIQFRGVISDFHPCKKKIETCPRAF